MNGKNERQERYRVGGDDERYESCITSVEQHTQLLIYWRRIEPGGCKSGPRCAPPA